MRNRIWEIRKVNDQNSYRDQSDFYFSIYTKMLLSSSNDIGWPVKISKIRWRKRLFWAHLTLCHLMALLCRFHLLSQLLQYSYSEYQSKSFLVIFRSICTSGHIRRTLPIHFRSCLFSDDCSLQNMVTFQMPQAVWNCSVSADESSRGDVGIDQELRISLADFQIVRGVATDWICRSPINWNSHCLFYYCSDSILFEDLKSFLSKLYR